MPDWLRLLIAILVLVGLLAIFVISFILYKKTPAPKGCEHLTPEDGLCHGCKQTNCHFYGIYNVEDEKKKEETGNEEKEETTLGGNEK